MVTQVSLPDSSTNLPVSRLDISALTGKASVIKDVKALTVVRSVGAHESATLSLSLDSRQIEALDGSLIRFNFGSSPSTSSFYGRVFDASKSQLFQSANVVSLSCIGSTYALKALAEPTIHMNSTPSAVMAETLRGTGISSVITTSYPMRYPRLTTSGRSKWEVAVTAATGMGASLSPLNGTIWVFSSVAELSGGASALVFSKSTSVLDSPNRTLIDFTAGSFSAPAPSGGVSFGYFNSANTAQVYTPKGRKPEDVSWTSDMYVSGDQLVDLARHVDAESPNGSQIAEATVKGTASIYPGMVVGVKTGGVDSLSDTWDGLWLVTKVTHSISSTEFTSSLRLVRDKYRKDRTPGGLIPFWARGGGSAQAPAMIAVDNNWVSNRGRT